MTTAIEHALLAVLTSAGGDGDRASDLISRAQRQSRTRARREREVVEIASLVVAGDGGRAAGLAREHLVAFPDDAELLARVVPGA